MENYLIQYNNVLEKSFFNYSGGDLSCDQFMDTIVTFLLDVKKKAQTLYFIGNGGSAAISVHMTADYLKNGGIRTHSMHDPATITCLGNDFGYEYIFSKQLEVVADADDVLVAISSSGNSPNVLNAIKTAREKACQVITFSGFQQTNQLRTMGDYNVYVPSMEYGVVESIHNMLLQQIVDEISHCK